uniref:Putative secreted peptide n=1 Tax=Anopheles braziliensis TaxID=58242 RepID=A0A2M3ZUR5_9DIPT
MRGLLATGTLSALSIRDAVTIGYRPFRCSFGTFATHRTLQVNGKKPNCSGPSVEMQLLWRPVSSLTLFPFRLHSALVPPPGSPVLNCQSNW